MSTEAPKKVPIGLGWKVRERRDSDGELLDCFLEAPRVEGMAYGLEVLGDDYTGYDGVQGKLKHCQMIAAWANAAPVSAEPVGEIVLFGGNSDLKEVSWRKGKMPPPGTKLYTAPVADPVSAEPTDDEIIDMAVEPLGIDCDRMPYGIIVFARTLLSRYSATPVAAQAQPRPTVTAGMVMQAEAVLNRAGGSFHLQVKDAIEAALDVAQKEGQFNAKAQQPVSGTSQRTEANNRRKALLENQGKGEVPSWTGHGDADAALIMLDRLDVSGGDNDRVDEISAIIRKLAAKQDQFRDAAQMIEPSGNSGELNFQAEYEAFKDAAWNKSGSPIGLMDGKNAAWWAWVNRAALAQQDADKVDAERWRAYRAAIAAKDSAFLGRGESYLSSLGLRAEVLPTEGQIDAAIDAARKEQT